MNCFIQEQWYSTRQPHYIMEQSTVLVKKMEFATSATWLTSIMQIASLDALSISCRSFQNMGKTFWHVSSCTNPPPNAIIRQVYACWHITVSKLIPHGIDFVNMYTYSHTKWVSIYWQGIQCKNRYINHLFIVYSWFILISCESTRQPPISAFYFVLTVKINVHLFIYRYSL